MISYLLKYEIMNSPLQEEEKATLAELESRARELENELSGIQSAIAILRARMNHGQTPATGKEVPLAPAWDTPIAISTPPQSQQTEKSSAAENIYLQALQPHHPLRSKWELGSGLESAQSTVEEIPAPVDDIPVATEMRLFGILSDGSAWERKIPFASIAAESGVILGRDGTVSHVVLEDASVSRAHVQFALNEYGLIACDLDSTNGTAVNGEPLSAYDNVRSLEDGNTITLGCITLQIEFI